MMSFPIINLPTPDLWAMGRSLSLLHNVIHGIPAVFRNTLTCLLVHADKPRRTSDTVLRSDKLLAIGIAHGRPRDSALLTPPMRGQRNSFPTMEPVLLKHNQKLLLRIKSSPRSTSCPPSDPLASIHLMILKGATSPQCNLSS